MFRTHWMIDTEHKHACPAGERVELRHRAVLKKTAQEYWFVIVKKNMGYHTEPQRRMFN